MNTTIRVMLKEPFEYIQTDLDIEVQLEPDGYIIEIQIKSSREKSSTTVQRSLRSIGNTLTKIRKR